MEPNKIRLDLSTAPWMECACSGKLFNSKLMFKKVSALISPTGKEEFVPIEILICEKCQKVPQFMWEKFPDLPEELKSIKYTPGPLMPK